VITQENVFSLEDVIRGTYDWNDRKRQFTSRQIALATDVLSDKGWIRKFEAQKSGY
jgi:nicotinamide riboside kinase